MSIQRSEIYNTLTSVKKNLKWRKPHFFDNKSYLEYLRRTRTDKEEFRERIAYCEAALRVRRIFNWKKIVLVLEYTSEAGFYFTIKSPKLEQPISTNDLVQVAIYFAQTAFPVNVSKDNPLLWVEVQKKEQELATFESVGLDVETSLLCDFLTRNNSTKQFDLTELLEAIAILSCLSKEPGSSSFEREELYDLITPYKWNNFSETEDITLQELLDHQNNFLWNLILNIYERKANRLQQIESLKKMLQRNF